MRISVVSHKGGVGKTTTAVHLASWMARHLGNTLLIDGDPNRSASLWKANGDGGLPCAVASHTEAALLSEPFEHLVFDTKARPDDDDLKVLAEGVDLIVIPTTPEDLAVDAAMLTVGKLRELERAAAYRLLITMAPPHPQTSGPDAREAMSEAGIPVFETIVSRGVAFQKAARAGVSVDRAPDRRASELWASYERVAQEAVGAIREDK